MITRKEIKLIIEATLDSLHEAQGHLEDALGIIGDKGNRIDVVGILAGISGIINDTENLIYDKSNDDYDTEESYQFVTEGKVTMLRKVNSL